MGLNHTESKLRA